MPATKFHGFTLIELLVVITIIVVLLALLTPALDKAIYEAEMATDLAGQRGIASAALMYAAGNRRSYPHREDAREGGPYDFASPNNIRDPRGGGAYDMRIRMADYWALKQLNCPFSTAVDLADDGTIGSTMVSTSYNLFFGWKYNGRAGQFRLGDRMGINSTARSTVLVADMDSYDKANNLSWASHPDQAGVMGEIIWQNFGDPARDPQASAQAYGAIIGDPNFSWTWSRWDCRAGTTTWRRGTLDDNFAFADGSAARYNDVVIDNAEEEPDEQRFVNAWFYRVRNATRVILPRE